MIISASYKTDIPAFYADWFINRLRAGFCQMTNPYGGQVHTIPLTSDAVDGFVFWTRNVGPFLDALAEVRSRGFPFYVQYTLTGYPRALEAAVARPHCAIALMRRLAGQYGRRAVVWRYDPIVISSLTPPEFHLANFAHLAGNLRGAVDEVVISFMHPYRKTMRNLAAAGGGFRVEDPPADQKRKLTAQLSDIATAHGMRLTVCSQRPLIAGGAADARCIDAGRLADVAGRPIVAEPRGHRPNCGCFASRDIGEYDTCPHGCAYCYAVGSRAVAVRRFREHDPLGPFLWQRQGRSAVCQSDPTGCHICAPERRLADGGQATHAI